MLQLGLEGWVEFIRKRTGRWKCSEEAHKNTIIICWVVPLVHWTINVKAQMAFPSSMAAPAPHNGLVAGGATQWMESESNKGHHSVDPAVGAILSRPRGNLASFLLLWSLDLGILISQCLLGASKHQDSFSFCPKLQKNNEKNAILNLILKCNDVSKSGMCFSLLVYKLMSKEDIWVEHHTIWKKKLILWSKKIVW